MDEANKSGAMPVPPSSGRKPKVDPPAPSMEVKASEPVQPVVEKVVEKSGPLMVVAIADGFFERVRRARGDKFMIPDKSKLGKWMKIV